MNYEAEQRERERRRRVRRERARTQTQAQPHAQGQAHVQLQMQLETQQAIHRTLQEQRAQREGQNRGATGRNRHGERRGAAPATSGHVATMADAIGSGHVAAPATSGHVATRRSVGWMSAEDRAIVNQVRINRAYDSVSDREGSIRVMYSSY